MSVDHDKGFVKPQKVTRDGFLGGRLTVTQPEGGFRAGLDSVLLGAGVGAHCRLLLDLGCGAGVAGLTGLAWHEELTALFCDSELPAVELARANIAANGFAGRARAAQCDVGASGPQRVAAGLAPDTFSTVIANPPYFASAAGTRSPDGPRATARHMPDGQLDRWVQTAVAAAAPRGEVIFIHPAASLAPLLAAFEARLGAVTVLPLLPRPGADAIRVLIRGIKGSRARLRLSAPLVLHAESGHAFAPHVKAILEGEARLLW